MALQQIYWLSLLFGGGTARGQIDLANGADVIGEVRNAGDDAVELGLIDLTRLVERLEPAVCLFGERFAQLLPLRGVDARLAPARGPVRIIERVFASRPTVHQRETVPEVVDVCGNRRSVRRWCRRRGRGQFIERAEEPRIVTIEHVRLRLRGAINQLGEKCGQGVA